MNEFKKYTPLNLPKGLVERLRTLKAAYRIIYNANLSYDEIIDNMISELANTDPKLYEMYTTMNHAMLENMEEDVTTEDSNSSIQLMKDIRNLRNNMLSTSKKLHDVIVDVINAAGRPLTVTEITKGVNALGTYSRKDGQMVPANQISARIKNYPHLFKVDTTASPKTVSLNK